MGGAGIQDLPVNLRVSWEEDLDYGTWIMQVPGKRKPGLWIMDYEFQFTRRRWIMDYGL